MCRDGGGVRTYLYLLPAGSNAVQHVSRSLLCTIEPIKPGGGNVAMGLCHVMGLCWGLRWKLRTDGRTDFTIVLAFQNSKWHFLDL